jgi:predicted RNA-binding Zn-ribbon protein involved in translation (DUF1610 family)
MAGRLMDFTCGACGTKHHIPRALAVTCPVCGAAPGSRCRDLRSTTGAKHRLTPHSEREALVP